MDIFTWSVPFVSEKVSEMLYFVLDPNKSEDISDDEFDDKNLQKMAQNNMAKSIFNSYYFTEADIMRNKIKFVSKLMKYQRSMRY